MRIARIATRATVISDNLAEMYLCHVTLLRVSRHIDWLGHMRVFKKSTMPHAT